MAIELLARRALEGPNIFYPQPAVALLVHGSSDLRGELVRLIKEWGLAVGVVVGHFRGDVYPLKGGELLTQLSFTCSLPTIGAEVGAAAVADLQAAERGDTEYNHDEQLFRLLRRRQREAPALPLLQLQAEALSRQVLLFRRPDGRMQLGLGFRSWSFDPAGLSAGLPVEPPWEQIGQVPLLAVGGFESGALARELAAAVRDQGRRVVLAEGGFDTARAAMADVEAEVLVLALDAASVLERGLPFERCSTAIVSSLAGLEQPMELAAGLHALALLPTGCAILSADEPRALALASRVAAQVTLVSEQGLIEPLAAHLQAGGRAVWRQNDSLILADRELHREYRSPHSEQSSFVVAALQTLL